MVPGRDPRPRGYVSRRIRPPQRASSAILGTQVPVFECVPNVSEGRDPDLVRRLARAAASAGAALLDVSSDPDHHRSVLTLAGTAEVLHGGLLALYELALEAIHLRRHEGIHPRIGAVDVVPFVPLGTAPMAAAVEAARRLAATVAKRFDLPVFLYGEAAREPQRRLAALRRGGTEGVAARLARGELRPDFGPPRLHPSAGATAIGARRYLAAFNVVLATADEGIARDIARRIRASSGGLPGVQALGVALSSLHRAQVTMNLVDLERTTLADALTAVDEEARRLGTAVDDVELVGLLPAAAHRDAVTHPLLRDYLTEDRILERRLAAAGLTELT